MRRKVTGGVVTERIPELSEKARLGLITHNVAVQLDEPPFHLEIVEEMCNYRSVAVNFEFSARFKNSFFLH